MSWVKPFQGVIHGKCKVWSLSVWFVCVCERKDNVFSLCKLTIGCLNYIEKQLKVLIY